MRQSREVLGTLGSATCIQDATGKWFVSLVETLRVESTSQTTPERGRVIGFDRGLGDLVVGTHGVRVTAPRWYRQSERKLCRANRAFARTKIGSAGRRRARQQLALVHRRIRNRRADFLHKLTTRLVQEYDGFCLEDLNTRGLARTKLAKSGFDAAWGEVGRQIQYKADWKGKPVVKIDRWYPSSKTCSDCGFVIASQPLAVRIWTCPGCGVTHDRDENAARNIRAKGLELLMLAAGHADS